SNDPLLLELRRLRTEKTLKLSFDNLKVVDGITVTYQNINSLTSKFKLILSDQWYCRSDILIFAETLSKPTDKFEITDFVEIFRSNAHCSSRGVICFVRKGINVLYLDHILKIQENQNKTEYHVELFGIKIQNYYI